MAGTPEEALRTIARWGRVEGRDGVFVVDTPRFVPGARGNILRQRVIVFASVDPREGGLISIAKVFNSDGDLVDVGEWGTFPSEEELEASMRAKS